MRLRRILTATWLNSWFWMVWRALVPGGVKQRFRREPRRDRGRERDRRPTEYSRTFCQSLRGGRQPEPGHHPTARCEIAHR